MFTQTQLASLRLHAFGPSKSRLHANLISLRRAALSGINNLADLGLPEFGHRLALYSQQVIQAVCLVGFNKRREERALCKRTNALTGWRVNGGKWA